MSFDSVIGNLRSIKREIPNMNKEIVEKSLINIRDMAIRKLIARETYRNGYFGIWLDDVNKWTIEVNKKGIGRLECNDEIGTYVEFGIGVRGSYSPHPEATSVGYQYNMPSEAKKEDGSWTFQDQRGYWWVDFRGYVGKYFLYDAFMEFKNDDLYTKICKQVFDKTMKRVIANV